MGTAIDRVLEASHARRELVSHSVTICRPDEAGDTFLARQRMHAPPVWLARRVLRQAMSDFDVNGLLGTYPLFLMSTAQWHDALGERIGGSLLDVGAAAGDVTETLAALFDPIVATDTSMPMVRRLRARGFDAHCVDLATTDVVTRRYGTVSALNVLDRCPDPLALLARLVESVEPGGTLLVSLPLPYRPCWYQGPLLRRPRSPLPLDGRTWDGDLDALVVVLEQFGLGIERIVRTPYLSGGDRHHSHYELDAAVIVASVAT